MTHVESVKRYCCDDISQIENYEQAVNDKTQTWECHHRLETHNSDGKRRLVDLSIKELKALGTYYYRPANELIFLTVKEHNSLHKKGKTTWMKGKTSKQKGIPRSKKTRRRISESLKGMHWFNNGKRNKFCYECPEGFVPGRLTFKV